MKHFSTLAIAFSATCMLTGAIAAQASAQAWAREPAPASADPLADLLRGAPPAAVPIEQGNETPRNPYDPELGVTAELNADIARRDREAEAADARAQADYVRREEDYVRRLAQQRADYDAAQAAHREALARQQADHAAAMEAWRLCVADRAYCAPPRPY